jgi:hypothetical protein
MTATQGFTEDYQGPAKDSPDDRLGRYTAPQVAEELSVDSSTVRKCRLPWLLKAFPESRIKAENGKFTCLALTLFKDYQNRVILDQALVPEEWVEAVQATYSKAVEPEVLPRMDEPVEFEAEDFRPLGGALATLSAYGQTLTRQGDNSDLTMVTLRQASAQTLDTLRAISGTGSRAQADAETQGLEVDLLQAYNQELERLTAIQAAKIKARQDFDAAVKPEAQG